MAKRKQLRRPAFNAILFGDDTFNSNAEGTSGPLLVEQLELLQDETGGLISGVHIMLQTEAGGFEFQRKKVVPALRKVPGIKTVSGFTMAPRNILDLAETAAAAQWWKRSVECAKAMRMTDLMWAGITPWLQGVDKPQPFAEVAQRLPLLAHALADGLRITSGKPRPTNLMLEPLSSHEVPHFPTLATLIGPALHAEELAGTGGKINFVPDTAHQGRAITRGTISPAQVEIDNVWALSSGRVKVVHISVPETRDEVTNLETGTVAEQLEMYYRMGFQGRFVVEVIPYWPSFVEAIGLSEGTVNYKKGDFIPALARSFKAIDRWWNERNKR
jgi:hypothetical protein